MKKIKFKSLTMRIWTTFAVIILVIICSISFIYLFAYKNITEKNRLKDLKVAHNILLKGDDFTKLNRFDELENLKESDHFIVNMEYEGGNNVMDIGKMKDSNPIQNNDIPKSPGHGDNELREWMTSFITAKVVANYISKPLKKLEEHTIRIAHKDWRDPILIKSKDEIGRLAEAMNFMQTELKRIDEEEKLFLQSISHDLKTPVMVIMSHAEAIIDGIYIESLEKTAEIIKDEAISLEKKIKQLLYLNTLDYVLENNNENYDIDLNKLLSHIIGRFEVVNSTIEWHLDIDKLIIKGNVDKIQVAIENILDNGLRYAETKISVKLKLEGVFAVLEIYNDGPSISSKSVDRIFENLYKDKTGNFGIGLAISKKIIDYHKGEIKAVNRDKGVSFIIKYPVENISNQHE